MSENNESIKAEAVESGIESPSPALETCAHPIVLPYVTHGRFAPVQRSWSCQECGVVTPESPKSESIGSAETETGLNLFRQLVSHKNALRDLDVFACNQGEHDAGCECFWGQCEAWAAKDEAISRLRDTGAI